MAIIAIDIDDVLSQTLNTLIPWYNHTYKKNLTENDYFTFFSHKVWNCTPEEATNIWRQFSKQIEFHEVKPLPFSKSIVAGLNHELHVVTSRRLELEKISVQWLHKHFPNQFKSLNFCQKNGIKRSKGEICKEMNVSLIIEDAPHHVMSCATLNIPVIMPPVPYNFSRHFPERDHHKFIYPIQDWREVPALIESILKT